MNYFSRWVIVGLALVLLAGCSTMNAYPPRAVPASAEVLALTLYMQSDTAVKCQDVECRNLWVRASVRSIDLYYGDWVAEIWKENSNLNLFSSIATMLLGYAGSFIAGPASPYLAAGTTAISGSSAAFSKSVMGDKGALPLIMTMNGSRENIIADLIECTMSSIEVCPMIVAMHKVEELYQTGSVPGGLSTIVEKATETKTQVRERMQMLKLKGLELQPPTSGPKAE
jgi:hypothetical protein